MLRPVVLADACSQAMLPNLQEADPSLTGLCLKFLANRIFSVYSGMLLARKLYFAWLIEEEYIRALTWQSSLAPVWTCIEFVGCSYDMDGQSKSTSQSLVFGLDQFQGILLICLKTAGATTCASCQSGTYQTGLGCSSQNVRVLLEAILTFRILAMVWSRIFR